MDQKLAADQSAADDRRSFLRTALAAGGALAAARVSLADGALRPVAPPAAAPGSFPWCT